MARITYIHTHTIFFLNYSLLPTSSEQNKTTKKYKTKVMEKKTSNKTASKHQV